MNEALSQLVRDCDGVVSRTAAQRVAPAHVWSYALRSGLLVAAFPGVAVHPDLVDDPATRRRAGLACAGPGAALSHTSALAVWGLPAGDTGDTGDTGDVHVTTGPGRRLRVPGIVAHRRAGFVAGPPQVLVRQGLPVTRLERSLVDAWPLARADAQQAPLLQAIGERMTTPQRVADALTQVSHLPGRAELRTLLDATAAGCRSELELWGYTEVFTAPGMPAFRWQVPVPLGSRTVYLDVYDPRTRTNFELDGAKYHAAPAHRERDLRRDAALAGLGILVVRFTHDRLVHHPDQVRHEIRTILATRHRQLAGLAHRAP